MNANAATMSREPSLWRVFFLGVPLLVATVLFIIWRTQLAHLANRPVESLGAAPPFQLVDQTGNKFEARQLQGKIWIADFIFTSCPGPCPIISTRLSEVAHALRDTDVDLVSFTVDPDKDTPEVLRAYAEKLGAQPQRWHFLTGAKPALYDLTKNGFKLAVDDSEPANPIHSTRVVLVDRHGQIRGYYEVLAPDGVTKVIADARHLLREQPK
jgi:protein SCO1